jgi:hypothetical protein
LSSTQMGGGASLGRYLGGVKKRAGPKAGPIMRKAKPT